MKVRIRPLLALCALAMCIMPASVLASGATLAEVEVGPYEVTFSPYLSDAQHILRVSCDSGEFFQQQFEAGEAPFFEAVDAEGFALADGGCNYELRPIMATGETESPGEPVYVQFGVLEVSQGMIEQRSASDAQQQN